MKKWQKIWLVSIVIIFSWHLFRDFLQDIGVKNVISTSFVKTDHSRVPWWYWQIFNTYVFEISGLILAGYALKKGSFGIKGWLTVFVAALFLTVWLYYWFYM